MNLNVIILAAGKGRRMNSALPKVLHTIGGEPMLQKVISTALKLEAKKIFVVCGHGREDIQEHLAHLPVTWVEQKEQLGTGHAAAQVLPYLENDSITLVLYGDVPLISQHTLEALVRAVPTTGVALLVAEFKNPCGLGRIVRDQNYVFHRIVEDKDATPEQKRIKEIYTGIMALPTTQLMKWLPLIDNKNAQGEYYLTEIPQLALKDKCTVATVNAPKEEEVLGVNDKKQLAQLERYYYQERAEEYMLKGMTIRDPSRCDIQGELTFGEDVEIHVNVLLQGKNHLGDNTTVGANTVLRNVTLGKNVLIKENCLIEDSIIDDNCTVGPFARIRPGTHLKEGAGIGNFVEIKKSIVGSHTKINHLSYVGDADIGNHANIGAGVITCNYDGVHKHKTIIGDNAFVGSDTQLIAPITVGEGATIGAGATISKDVPAHELTVTKKEQVTITGWKRPVKEEK